MAFTLEERAKIRLHLGYPGTNPVASINMGIPGAIGTDFLIDRAMDLTRDDDGTGDRVRNILCVMDKIECQMVAAQARRAVDRADTLTLNKDETDDLEAEYCRWGHRLSEIFGVKPYRGSERYKRGTGRSRARRQRRVSEM